MSGADVEEILRSDRSTAVTNRYDVQYWMAYLVVGSDEYASRGFVTDITCFGRVLGHGSKMPHVWERSSHC